MHQIDLFHLDSVALILYSYLFTGADITDYFNYGFTEDTWKAYQQRQHVLRSQGQAYHSNNTYGGGGGSGHHYHHHNNAQHQINVCVEGKLKVYPQQDRKSTRLNSSHVKRHRMPSSA